MKGVQVRDEGGEDVGGLCTPSDEGVGVGEERHEEALEDGEEGEVGEVEDARGGEECAEVEAGECGEERALWAGSEGDGEAEESRDRV